MGLKVLRELAVSAFKRGLKVSLGTVGGIEAAMVLTLMFF